MDLRMLNDLQREAQDAYNRARALVYDRLPTGETVSTMALTPDQDNALKALTVAENALADYRQRSAANTVSALPAQPDHFRMARGAA